MSSSITGNLILLKVVTLHWQCMAENHREKNQWFSSNVNYMNAEKGHCICFVGNEFKPIKILQKKLDVK
jgi:hypothetical protein